MVGGLSLLFKTGSGLTEGAVAVVSAFKASFRFGILALLKLDNDLFLFIGVLPVGTSTCNSYKAVVYLPSKLKRSEQYLFQTRKLIYQDSCGMLLKTPFVH